LIVFSANEVVVVKFHCLSKQELDEGLVQDLLMKQILFLVDKLNDRGSFP